MKKVRKISNSVMKLPTLLVALVLGASVAGLRLCPERYLPIYLIVDAVLVSFTIAFFMGIYAYWAAHDPDRLGTTIYLEEPNDPSG